MFKKKKIKLPPSFTAVAEKVGEMWGGTEVQQEGRERSCHLLGVGVGNPVSDGLDVRSRVRVGGSHTGVRRAG